jgi:hypothetical protein
MLSVQHCTRTSFLARKEAKEAKKFVSKIPGYLGSSLIPATKKDKKPRVERFEAFYWG